MEKVLSLKTGLPHQGNYEKYLTQIHECLAKKIEANKLYNLDLEHGRRCKMLSGEGDCDCIANEFIVVESEIPNTLQDEFLAWYTKYHGLALTKEQMKTIVELRGSVTIIHLEPYWVSRLLELKGKVDVKQSSFICHTFGEDSGLPSGGSVFYRQ